MQVYKIAKVWRIISYVLTPIALIPFGVLLLIPIIPDVDINLEVYYWFLLPLSVTMLFVIIVAFVNIITGRFVIDKNKIYTTGLLNNKQIYFNEIKGYRITEHFIFIEAKNSKNRIKVSSYYEKGNEIKDWLILNYKNLDEVERIQEKQEILSNHELGWTVKEREAQLTKTKRLAKILNWSGTFIAVGTILLLNSFKYIILLFILLPIICLVAIIFSKGFLRIDERKNTAYPTLFWAFFITTSVVFFRGLMFYKIFDYTNVWFPSIIIALGLITILVINNQGYVFYKAEKFSTFLTLSIFIMFGYGFGTTINLNCIFDSSHPEKFQTTILKKRISTGKSTSHYFQLEKWNNQKDPKEVSVQKDFFEKHNVNDTITINLKKGRLNIPWFELKDN